MLKTEPVTPQFGVWPDIVFGLGLIIGAKLGEFLASPQNTAI
jgi:hypothetical protein